MEMKPLDLKHEFQKLITVSPFLAMLIGISYVALLADYKILAYLMFYLGIFIYCLPSWRMGLLTFFLWFIIVGALRKWFFPEAHQALYFTPNFFVLSSLVSFVFSGEVNKIGRLMPRPVIVIYSVILVYSFFSIVLTFDRYPLIGFTGMFLHFSYSPLIFLIPCCFFGIERVNSLMRLINYTSILPFIIGCIQYVQPEESLWNKTYTGDPVAVSYDRTPRISSTFSYTGGYGIYIMIVFGFLLYELLTMEYKKRFARAIFVLTLFILSLFNILFINSTTVIFICGAMVMAVLLCSIVFMLMPFKFIVLLLMVFPLYKLGEKLIVPKGHDPVEVNVVRTKSRTFDYILSITLPSFNSDHGLAGKGIGTACQGISRIVNEPLLTEKSVPENPADRLLTEMGYLGLTLHYLFIITILFFACKGIISMSSKAMKLCCIVVLVYCGGVNLTYLHNYAANAYLHTMLGILVSVYSGDVAARLKAASAQNIHAGLAEGVLK